MCIIETEKDSKLVNGGIFYFMLVVMVRIKYLKEKSKIKMKNYQIKSSKY